MTQKKIRDLAPVPETLGSYYLVIETPEGTKQTSFSELCKSIFAAEITETTEEFPEIEKNDTIPAIIGKLKKWQQDTLKDYEVMKRESMASYGYFGIEWSLDELMALVKAGSWDKFAVGDYFIETTSSGEKIMWEVAGKNSYLHCGDTELKKKHIVCCPRDCLETYYKFNTTHKNAGGYAASLMPENLETEANKFSSKLQGYMTTIRRLENNKGTWAWASRRIFLPSIVELCGSNGFAGGYSPVASNQLLLFTGGNAHILKGVGFNNKTGGRISFWSADPSAADTTSFCLFDYYGTYAHGAGFGVAIAPLIVLS